MTMIGLRNMMFFKQRKVNTNNESEMISFFIMHDDFAEYNWINTLPKGLHTISFFEANENSFSTEVMTVFIEVLKALADPYFAIYKMEKNLRMYRGIGNVCNYVQDEKYLYKTSRGVDTALLQLQADPLVCWEETEIYCSTRLLPDGDSLKSLKHGLETGEFLFYFLLDAIRASLTIKFPKESNPYEIEQLVMDICQKIQVPVFLWNS